MKKYEILVWYLNIFKNIIEVNDLNLFEMVSKLYYIHYRDYLDFNLEEEILKNILNFNWIIWEFYLKNNNFWYLEWNYDIIDLKTIIQDLLNFLSKKEIDLKILDKKILEFLEKNDLLYLYN